MGLLADRDREAIQARFDAELTKPVRVVLFSEPAGSLHVPGRRPCASCNEVESLMKEISELSDFFNVEIHNVREKPELAHEWGIEWIPSYSVQADDAGSGVRFLGFPAGFEFMSFLETVLSIPKDDFGLKAESVEKTRAIDTKTEIKTFSTPT